MNAFKKQGDTPYPNSRLILLAEDHPLNQKVAVLLLQRMGFDAHIVNNGAEAVEACRQRDYDAILMDCHMPEMDGFEATRRIRLDEVSTGKHTPIIAVTALAMTGDRERCLEAGMDDYVPKPINREVLNEKLVYWMNPGTLSSLCNPGKVIRIFDTAFALTDGREDPVDVQKVSESYGDEARDLLLLFANASERLMIDLRDALEKQDIARVGRLAHEVKGSSWAVGADEMARLAVFLEQAAGQDNWRMIQRTFVRLDHHFTEVKQFLDDQLIIPQHLQVKALDEVSN